MVSYRCWVRDTMTVAGDYSDPEDMQTPRMEDSWKVIDVRLPWDIAKHWCCWQQTWGVGLPESSVDWETVNSLGKVPWDQNELVPEGDISKEGNEAALAIRQAVDTDYWGRVQAVTSRQWATNPLDAPAGYSCGIILYPGPGCDYEGSSDSDYQTTISDGAMGHITRELGEGYDQATEGMMQYAGDWLTAYDDMLSSAAGLMTFGITGPIVDGLNTIGEQILEAREEAASANDDIWTFHWTTGIFAPKPVEVKVLDMIPGREGSLIGPAAAPWLKRILEIACYLVFAYALLSLFLPKTIMPGGGSSNDDGN